MRNALISLGLILGLGALGLVVGFGGGWIYAPLFGSHEGHGLGDLSYLFVGALLGAVVGIGAGIFLAVRRGLAPRQAPSGLNG